MRKVIINLEDYRVFDRENNVKSRVFAGRPRGKAVRDASKIDDLVEKSDEVEINVPDDIRALNPSFIEEFLFNVVKKYGANGYKDKVKFVSENGFKFEAKLQEGVNRILRRMSGLDS
jgi:hypothetical protein